jgi:hypothetical protein
MSDVAALLVVMGFAFNNPPTFTLHRFERAELCEATAQTLTHTAHMRAPQLHRHAVVAFCIPAEPRREGNRP